MTSATSTPPDDVETLKAMLAERDALLAAREEEIAKRDGKIEHLEDLVRKLLKRQFGRSSERRASGDGEGGRQGAFLFPEILAAAQRLAEATGAEGTVEVLSEGEASDDKTAGDDTAQEKETRPRGRGRRKSGDFPAHLPRVRTTIDLPESLRMCCSAPMARIGEDVTTQLERYETTIVLEIARTKYACRCCSEGVRTAPGPEQPIEKGLLGTSFLAHVLTERFARHMPYHRLEAKYKSEGLSLSRSVLCRSALRCAELLEPIVDAMRRAVLAAPIVQTDDTPVQIQLGKSGKPKRGFVWIYKDLHGRCVFDFTESRSREGPMAFLGDYRGYLQADAFPGYDVFFRPGGATEVACWAHARRRFVEAEATEPKLAKLALDEIRGLYALEAAAKRDGLSADAVLVMRQTQSRPILARLADRLLVWKGQVLDKSPMGNAIRYAQAQWKALCRFTEDARLPLDNSAAENALRAFAVGRKNWLFVGHEEAGKKGAVIMSLVATCKAIGVDPTSCLADVLSRLSVETDAAKLTPHGWKAHFEHELLDRRQDLLRALTAARR